MPQPLFLATQRFDAADGDVWQRYCDWARIPGLQEVVSLDSTLCSRLVDVIADEDWPYIVWHEHRFFFREPSYLIQRLANVTRKNILGVYRNPDTPLGPPSAVEDFVLLGYDLIEDQTQISALTNCGGFPEVFANAELNRFGLLEGFARACEVRQRLAACYPEDPHAQCEMYALWRWSG